MKSLLSKVVSNYETVKLEHQCVINIQDIDKLFKELMCVINLS